MKMKLVTAGTIIFVLAACSGGGTTRTKPSMQTRNIANAGMPWGQTIEKPVQPQLVESSSQDMMPVVQTAVESNHAATTPIGTVAVTDDYVRASTELFRCDNGMNITIKHLQADTITIADSHTKGNSILKRNPSMSGEVYEASDSVLGKQTQWHQNNAMAHLKLTQKNRAVATNCVLIH